MTAGFRRYRARPVQVFARQVFERSVVVTAVGILIARTGDWVVLDGNGNTLVMSNEVFQQTYEVDGSFPPAPATSVRRRTL